VAPFSTRQKVKNLTCSKGLSYLKGNNYLFAQFYNYIEPITNQNIYKYEEFLQWFMDILDLPFGANMNIGSNRNYNIIH
jgi:hypothetical protein